MLPVSSESTRETIVLTVAASSDSSVTRNQARNCILMAYKNPQSVFALQQIIIFIFGVYTERFICNGAFQQYSL